MARRRTQPVLEAGVSASKSKRPTRKAATKTRAARTAKKADDSFGKKVIALVYDFDGTLSPRPMQEYAFMPKIGVDPQDFWNESNKIAREQQADPLITYMHLLYKKAKEKGVRIDREDLVAQGRDVDLFPGVTEWFSAIQDYVAEHPTSQGVELRHYLVSSGLTEIIEGTSIYNQFHNVFASEYWFDAYDLPYPKRVITDTGKTQYIFRINKGIEDLGQSINEHMPEGRRPVPFSNMIYFGDGDTDVPSMAVMRKNGGYAVAVHRPGKAVENCIKLFEAQRCDFFAPADYRVGSALYNRTCLLLDRILADIRIGEEVWQMERQSKPNRK